MHPVHRAVRATKGRSLATGEEGGAEKEPGTRARLPREVSPDLDAERLVGSISILINKVLMP